MIWIRWDKRDRSIHVSRMIGPQGNHLSIKSDYIAAWREDVPLVQPIWSDGGAIGWGRDVRAAFDVSEPGVSRLYCIYQPHDDTDPRDVQTKTDLTFWNGREYVNDYEFRITSQAEPPDPSKGPDTVGDR